MIRNKARARRHNRVRKRVSGTAQRPRLVVFRSNRNIYVQLVDDLSGRTLAAASTLEESLKDAGNTVDAARKVGETLAERAIEKGVESVVFDRGGYRYHGKVKALGDAARGKGLRF